MKTYLVWPFEGLNQTIVRFCFCFFPSFFRWCGTRCSSRLVLSGEHLSADLCWPWGACAPCSWRWPPLSSARTRTLTGRGTTPTWRSVSSLRWLIVNIECSGINICAHCNVSRSGASFVPHVASSWPLLSDKRLFETKRKDQLNALKNLVELNDINQQYKIIDIMLKGLFKVGMWVMVGIKGKCSVAFGLFHVTAFFLISVK